MEAFNSDLVLHVVQYMGAVEAGRLASCSRRFYYLVHQYRDLSGPELVTSASWDPVGKRELGLKQVIQNGIRGLQKEPTLVLGFSNPRSHLADKLPCRLLNENVVILGAIAGDIQVNQKYDAPEHKSNASIMLANFPNAVVQPFVIQHGRKAETDINALKKKLLQNQVGWKAMIVYACGHGGSFAETFISSIQQGLPGIAIVGGICSSGYISKTPTGVSDDTMSKEEISRMTIRQLKNLNRFLGGEDKTFLEKAELAEYVFQLSQSKSIISDRLMECHDSIFGIVLGGEAPVKSMVSRGVRSVIQGPEASLSSSPFTVHSTKLVRPEDDDFLFRGRGMKPMHMIRSLKHDDKIVPAEEMINRVISTADFIGIKRQSQDGFELHLMSPYCQAAEQFLVMTNGSAEEEASLKDAEINFFALCGDACLSDMERTVEKLKEQTQGEKILGAVMFSCNGRGPQRGGLITEPMADARRFSKGFPNVPCLGFYAGGEIGPLALAGNENVFQTGRVALQGFTAVFALFIVPVVERPNYHLDDSLENVTRFVKDRLS
eukprot:scaffold7017_cov134-Cylindrotheca_fusiformis.AAC.11